MFVRLCSPGRSERRPTTEKANATTEKAHRQECLCYRSLLADRFNLIGAFGPVRLEFVFVNLRIAHYI